MVISHAKVPWLCRERCLEKFWNFKGEIRNFMTKNGCVVLSRSYKMKSGFSFSICGFWWT